MPSVNLEADWEVESLSGDDIYAVTFVLTFQELYDVLLVTRCEIGDLQLSQDSDGWVDLDPKSVTAEKIRMDWLYHYRDDVDFRSEWDRRIIDDREYWR